MADFTNENNKEFRPLILKLGQKITDRLGRKITPDDPEYWGLACIVTDEMAEVALKMDVRKPMTLEQIAKKTKSSDLKKLEDLLQEMSVAGLLEYNWENPKHEKQYVLPMFVPGSAEFTNMNQKQLDEHPELGRFFARHADKPLSPALIFHFSKEQMAVIEKTVQQKTVAAEIPVFLWQFPQIL